MTPYDGLFFFYISFILILPVIIMGLKGKRSRRYSLFINIVMILLMFSSSKKQFLLITGFYFLQLILTQLYLKVREKYNQRWILWMFLVASLMPLFLVKWGHLITTKSIGYFGFLGVSYLSFKSVQILIEIYDGLIKDISISEFTYFIMFFPTISSGPIDRSRRFNKDVEEELTKEQYSVYLREGILKIFLGVLYKFAIGAIIYKYWIGNIGQDKNFLNMLSYMYGYSFYLFFDFAGYSLMAIGLSYILGIKTPDNFNLPFISKDIKDFWNRWHMSLSFWFRDYLYTRFVMAALKGKWFKNRYTASYIGFVLIMFCMGVWHGTEVFYIIYGVYHGVLIVCTDYYQRKSNFHKKYKKKTWYTMLSTVVTFNLVCLGFLIFSGYLFK